MTVRNTMFDAANVVVVAPHPDDESLVTGGLIQTALERGATVSVILLTDGDRNPWPQRVVERRLRIGADERARWGRRRRAEAERALAVLGVDASAVHFLGWPDMGLTARLITNARASTRELADLVAMLLPTRSARSLLVIPALADRHPDHSATHVLVQLALAQLVPARAELTPHTLGYIVHGHVHLSAAELPMEERCLRRKVAAVEEHQTQLVLSRRRMLKYAKRPECFTSEPTASSKVVPSQHVLRWSIGAMPARLSRLLLVSNAGVWWLSLKSSEQSISAVSSASDRPRVLRRGSGLTLELPASLLTVGPVYAKLAATIDSPWIYDRWGWQHLDGSP